MKIHDKAVRIKAVRLYFLPIQARTPYKFGGQSLSEVTCVRVALTVERNDGKSATGWGETPLSVPWAWPGGNFHERFSVMQALCRNFADALPSFSLAGHPLEISHSFQESHLGDLCKKAGGVPYLPALVCLSAFDLALYDAFGRVHGVPVFEAMGEDWMARDLGCFIEADGGKSLAGVYPETFLEVPRPRYLKAWHSVGAGDCLETEQLSGNEPEDGYPNTLVEWIERDGLTCLKIKLTGQDYDWDLQRILNVGAIARRHGCHSLCTDYNSTVAKVDYVARMLDEVMAADPETYSSIRYVEQPFPYEMKDSPQDVRDVSSRKPLYMDESAHDWRLVREGHSRGWTGVALKTCKTLTNALLMLAWARTHDMPVMVQDLTNPRLAQVTHALLAAHSGSVMGLETNSMQFYPDASLEEEKIHPGLFRRREGRLDLSSIRGAGFGYGDITQLHLRGYGV